jgi:cyclic-di-AMP phosphodiesterase PgpH
LLKEPGRLITLVLICASAVALSCFLSVDPWRAEVVPLLAAVMVIALVYSQMLAILAAFCLSLLISMSTVADIGHFATLMVLCFTIIIPLRQVSSRSTLIKAGFALALVAFTSVWAVSVLGSHDYADSWKHPAMLTVGLKFAGWSLVCCYVVAGSLPFIESAFGIVTDISLLELTDVSHPLLQELARRAPGTYNHSITVASIGEAAADAVGANGLLLRVGAYFHDIGKSLKPDYFIENITAGQENPHGKLAPAMSALIIIGHVKDGLEMAEQHNLPRRLIDFIEQHHGTTLVEYFFREAANRADVDHRTDADESTFRYPGRKPQTKETGVMMLADAVESASRSLSEPTPKRIQSLVHGIMMKRVMDGQFDECGLTMSELHIIKASLVKSLLAVHHGRVKYPDQKTA